MLKDVLLMVSKQKLTALEFCHWRDIILRQGAITRQNSDPLINIQFNKFVNNFI